MKSWKKKWKDELDSVFPALDKKILNEKTSNAETEAEPKSTPVHNRKRRYIWAAISGLVAAVLVLCVVFGGSLFLPEVKQVSAVAVEINPGVVFVVDDGGKVKSVSSLNSDGDLIVSDKAFKAEIIGTSVEDATKAFVDRAARYGFIDFTDAAVRISAYDGMIELGKIKSSVENYFMDKGIPAVVFDQKISEKTFAEIAGLEIGKNDIVKAVEKLPELFTERSIYNKNLDDIKEQYIQEVIMDNVKANMESAVNSLPSSPDNNEQIEQLKWYLDNLDSVVKNPLLINDFIISFMNIMDGEFAETFNDLISIPETQAEYLEKLKKNYDSLRSSRAEENKGDYDLERDKITEEQKQAHLDGVMQNHNGSLENFWEDRKNKK